MRASEFVTLAEKLLQRRVDIFFVVDTNANKAVFVLQPVAEDRKQRSRRAAIAGRAFLANLAIAKEVAGSDQLIREFHCFFIVGVVVVAVRKVKGIDIPVAGPVALFDDVERQLIRRRNDGAARLALGKKLLLCNLFGFGVMRDKDDLDVVVLG